MLVAGFLTGNGIHESPALTIDDRLARFYLLNRRTMAKFRPPFGLPYGLLFEEYNILARPNPCESGI
ncbi:hypothetical protein D9611_013358 [Ephemerocybe angulata]|uniref:Uncharacterized protein n=1 Tax=Ephemerocybe angulata TaxID=980116 RepID=A0A8H5FJ57_9AGAR|nr:hypothetical protein D9611_013358 [Tulosesus angulatus]